MVGGWSTTRQQLHFRNEVLKAGVGCRWVCLMIEGLGEEFGRFGGALETFRVEYDVKS